MVACVIYIAVLGVNEAVFTAIDLEIIDICFFVATFRQFLFTVAEAVSANHYT